MKILQLLELKRFLTDSCIEEDKTLAMKNVYQSKLKFILIPDQIYCVCEYQIGLIPFIARISIFLMEKLRVPKITSQLMRKPMKQLKLEVPQNMRLTTI